MPAASRRCPTRAKDSARSESSRTLRRIVTYVFTVDDLAALRFAVSPSWELASALRLVRDPARAGLHLGWLARAREALGGVADLADVLALLPPDGYVPDFLTPPPRGPLGTIEEDLRRVAATTRAQIHAEIARMERQPATAPPAATVLATTLAAAFSRALAPDWPRVAALLAADVDHHARRLAQDGPAAMLGELHPAVRWDGDRLHVEQRYEATVHLRGRGLLLVPSAFAWFRAHTITRRPWQPSLIYPARGIGTLWDTAATPSTDALARLLGATRARILVACEAPASTTDLAARLAVSAGGASQHLRVLHQAGLVRARREGRSVLYARTPLGDAVVAGEDG